MSKLELETQQPPEPESKPNDPKPNDPSTVNKNPAPADAPKSGTRAKAGRIPEAWVVSPKLRAACLALGASDDDIDREHGGFVDYWLSRPKDFAKADWDATFRGWIRRMITSGQIVPNQGVPTKILRAPGREAYFPKPEEVPDLTDAFAGLGQ